MSRSSLPLAAAALVAAGFLIAGCGPGSSSSSGSAGSSKAPSTGSSSSSSSSSAPTSSGSGSGFDTTLFPATVGNTWVYQSTLAASSETGTETNKITAVTPDSAGERVTITDTPDISGLPSKTTTLTYQLNSDGSIGVPFSQFDSSTVQVMGGGILWPSAAQLASGQPHTSTLSLRVTSEGHAIAVKGHVTVKGEGTQSVTVPAGTYQATVVDEAITEAFDGITITISVKTYLANGVGPVKSVASTTTAGRTATVSSEVLKSFTKG